MIRTVLLTTISLSLFAGCDGLDGISGATKKKKPAIASIATAESLGNRTGLNGTLIRYMPAKADQALLYRGGIILNSRGMGELSANGIKSVLCPLTEPELPELAAARDLPFQSIHFTGETLDLPTAKALIAYMQAAAKPMYLCCHGGSHRAGILAMLYRIHVQGADFNDAKAEFLSLGGSTTKDAAMLAVVRATLTK